MSAKYDLERRIADYYESEASGAAPVRVLQETLATIAATPQRRVFIRVPWRLPTMNAYARFATVAVVLAMVGAIGYAVLGFGRAPDTGGVPMPSPIVTPSPGSGATEPSALTETYTSALHGYTISYPTGWNVRAATEAWTSSIPFQGSAYADVIGTSGNRFLGVASQPLAGRSDDQWFELIASDDGWDDTCEPVREPVTVDGESGLIVLHCDWNGIPTALVAAGDRGYVIVLYGIDQPETLFREILATVRLDPHSAVDPSPSASP